MVRTSKRISEELKNNVLLVFKFGKRKQDGTGSCCLYTVAKKQSLIYKYEGNSPYMEEICLSVFIMKFFGSKLSEEKLVYLRSNKFEDLKIILNELNIEIIKIGTTGRFNNKSIYSLQIRKESP